MNHNTERTKLAVILKCIKMKNKTQPATDQNLTILKKKSCSGFINI